MLLEDHFSFLSPDDIRIKGTRVGIETIIADYPNAARPTNLNVSITYWFTYR